MLLMMMGMMGRGGVNHVTDARADKHVIKTTQREKPNPKAVKREEFFQRLKILYAVMSAQLFVCAAFLIYGSSAEVSVRWGKEPMKLSSTGPDSTLPTFFFMAGAEEGGGLYDGYGYTGGRGEPRHLFLQMGVLMKFLKIHEGFTSTPTAMGSPRSLGMRACAYRS